VQYMLLLFTDATEAGRAIEVAVRRDDATAIRGHLRDGRDSPAFVALEDGAVATTLRRRDAGVLICDGPCVEGPEELRAIRWIEASDLDEALGIARDALDPSVRAVEIRPVSVAT